MARPRKARLEGEVSKAELDGEAEMTATQLDDAVALFKARFPDEWEAIRLCPLQHGLDVMAERLARG
jgi:hypothetical protein